ncbi:hypothetical protein SFSGTM_00930 [Sulfuriferula nivalis]|uniref:Uncharacterized protein n=2 Tax=Sulfuriferula nivalis TaxID=2675298 RepID=A0A809RCL3_9PROT|nr:hypothetical protein SFSGTM_00930 [Sulfuriferula nivalis]
MSTSGCASCQSGSGSNSLQAYQQLMQAQQNNSAQQNTQVQEVQKQIAQQANSVPPSQNQPTIGSAVGGVINIKA